MGRGDLAWQHTHSSDVTIRPTSLLLMFLQQTHSLTSLCAVLWLVSALSQYCVTPVVQPICVIWRPKGWFTHSMPSAAVSDSHLPCHAHDAPMPCSAHAVLLKATAQHSRQETACGLSARVRFLPATMRNSTKIVIRNIPIFLTTVHTYDCKEW